MTNRTLNEFIMLSQMPRPSQMYDNVFIHLYYVAKTNGYKFSLDKAHNIIIDIPPCEGYENKEVLMLQAHYDMVCVSNNNFDFSHPITTYVEDGFLKAKNTSLGADNGIGVALILSSIKNFPHGPIRAIFTADEEIGLVGASKLDSSFLQGKYLINLDNMNLNSICVSSAGNTRVILSKEICYVPNNKKGYKVTISNLIGGHSGLDINKSRLSSYEIVKKIFDSIDDIDISSIEIGSTFNAIATDASITFSSDHDVKKIVDGLVKFYSINETEKPIINCKEEYIDFVLSIFDVSSIIKLMNNVFYGVIKSKKGNTISSLNVGKVAIEDNKINFYISYRSNENNEMEIIDKNLRLFALQTNFEYTIYNSYPSWDYKDDNRLLDIAISAYNVNDIPVEKISLHCGLEPSYFMLKNKGLSIISIGPNIYDPHSTSERLELSSIEKIENVLKYIFENI